MPSASPRKTNSRNKFVSEPFLINYLRQALKERIALLLYLLAQAMMRDEVDIHQSIFLGHGDIASFGNEVRSSSQVEFCRQGGIRIGQR